MCAREFTLTCLPQPAQELPTPLIFMLSKPRQAEFFYVLLKFNQNIRTSLVGGPFNLTDQAELRQTKGNLMGALTVGADDRKVHFLCSNGSWINGAWVLPNSSVSYFVAPQCSVDDLTSPNRPYIDMAPATRVMKLLALDCGVNCNIPISVSSQIPGYSSSGFYFKKEDFEALKSRTTVTFSDDLFCRVAEPETVQPLARFTMDPDIMYLLYPTIHKKWKGMSRDVREMLQKKACLPMIQNISKITPVRDDHVFKLECSIDGGQTFASAHVLLSHITTVAKKLNVFDDSRRTVDHETVDELMSFLHGEDKHGNNWMAQLAKQAEANKKAEAKRRETEAELRKMDEQAAAHSGNTELEEVMEHFHLARLIAPTRHYEFSVQEEAERFLNRNNDDDVPMRQRGAAKRTASQKGAAKRTASQKGAAKRTASQKGRTKKKMFDEDDDDIDKNVDGDDDDDDDDDDDNDDNIGEAVYDL
jgi:hypothetical protein